MKMGYVELSKGFITTVDIIGIAGFFIIITTFAAWVFWCFFSNLKVLKSGEVH
jgi:hypothetical protein